MFTIHHVCKGYDRVTKHKLSRDKTQASDWLPKIEAPNGEYIAKSQMD